MLSGNKTEYHVTRQNEGRKDTDTALETDKRRKKYYGVKEEEHV